MTRMMENNGELCNMDDMSLYYAVVAEMNPLIKSMRFDTVMKNRAGLGIPPMSSVSRAKRKIQANRPDLKPNERARTGRIKKEAEFFNYAKV